MGQVRLSVSLGTIPSYGDTTDGMILDGVRDNSPASKAGLKAGDKIVKLAGKDVRNAMDYTYVLGSMKPGEEYERTKHPPVPTHKPRWSAVRPASNMSA